MERLICVRNIFLSYLLLTLEVGFAWKCQYKEFPVNTERIKGIWYIYGTIPQKTNRCFLADLDLYWTRITQTDYENFAVELHCSMPWFRHQMAIYTRSEEPSSQVLQHVEKYLKSVRLSVKDFQLIDRKTCTNETTEPLQRWHLSKYMHLDYNPHYVKPLVVDENI